LESFIISDNTACNAALCSGKSDLRSSLLVDLLFITSSSLESKDIHQF
jgi:hypothetical protein